MNRAIRLLCSVVLLVILAPSVAFSAPPKGAVKLARSKIVQKDGFFCGNIKGKTWVPGRRISGGYFYSYQAERTNLRGQLKRASKKNKAKIRAKIDTLTKLIETSSGQCSISTTPTPQPSGTPTPGPQALRFDFSGAVGLALSEATGAASLYAAASGSNSNLNKVDGGGNQSPAVASGSATISKFLIAPNDKLYVLFSVRTNLQDTSKSGSCLLAEVSRTTGQPSCIDDSLTSINWLEKPANDPIQFDAQGAVYYLGNSQSGDTVLRKYGASGKLDLINQNISIEDFLVLSDGSVILYGSTANTDASWIRKITVSGSLQTIKNVQRCNGGLSFIKKFPDGKLYFGINDCNLYGVYSMNPSSQSFDERPWFGWSFKNGEALPEPVKHECSPPNNDLESWSRCGTEVTDMITTPSQKVFGITNIGWNNTRKALVQYYGDYSRPVLSVTAIRVFQAVLGSVIAAGINSSGQNILTLFDTSNNSELQLIGPDSEIEIYHLNYVASTNRIMFDGLRFSDNKYVIGQYDFNTMTFSASQTGSTKLVDFKTF